MPFIPANYTATLEAWDSSTVDALGVPIAGWADPVSHPVCGWATPKSAEPKLAGHDRVTVDVELYAPSDFPAGPRDRVTVGGHAFEVVGEPEDYTHGPWWNPGVRVWNLRRVDG